MNGLQAFMVTGYALTGAGLCALASVIPSIVTQATLAIGVAVCFWRAYHWYQNA